MNFLTLCQRLRSLAAITGTGPTDVTDQTGEYERVVNWVHDAWVKIQTEREGKWKFLHSEFTKDTVADTQNYEFYTTDGVQSFNTDSFFIYLKSAGANTRKPLVYMEYKKFKKTYTDQSITGEPSVVTITPDNKLRLYPVPDDIYTIEGGAYLKPVSLAANTDTPATPESYHLLLVYRALLDYAGYEETDRVYQYAQREYTSLYNQLVWTHADEEPEEMTVRPE